jgi:hypothetical protein
MKEEELDVEGAARFGKRVNACLADLNVLVPTLNERYPTTVIIEAMAVHAGAAIQVLLRKKLCDERQANLFIQHIEDLAFPEQAEQARAAQLAGEPSEPGGSGENSPPH